MRKVQKKGQLFSTDAMISAVVFIIVLIFLLSLWNLYSLRLTERVALDELERNAFAMANVLSQTPGYPIDWEDNPTNASVFGFRSRHLEVDASKVSSFFATNVTVIKTSFNIERFGAKYELLSENATTLLEVGDEPDSEDTVVAVTRLLEFNGQITSLRVSVWGE